MTHENDPKTEELLCRWAGGVLTGARPPDKPPVDAHLLDAFARRHGLEAYIGSDPAALSETNTDRTRGARDLAVALEMARRQEFAVVYSSVVATVRYPPLVIKGQALAYTFYPAPWYRPRGDVDMLLDARDIDAAVRVLEGLGYARVTAFTGDLVMTQVCLGKTSAGVRHVWDLHWELSNRPAYTGILSHEELRREAVDIRLKEATFIAPGPAHGLLIACQHLVGHHLGEARLIWMYDIHLLVAAFSETELKQFRERASAAPALQVACHAALAMVLHYLPSTRMENLCRELDPGPGARLGTARRQGERLLEDLRATGKGRRVAMIRQHLFPPAVYMIQRYPVRHRWQLPVWYLVRIVRALPKLLRRR